MTSYAFSASDIWVFYFHVILTSEWRLINIFLLILDLKSKLSKIKPIFWQICKFLHFSVPGHIHNKRLPWQHLSLMRIVIMCKMTPISVRLNLKNFILISCAVLELLRKVS